MKELTEGAGGGTTGGGVTARGGPEAIGVGFGFPICCCADPKADGMKYVARSAAAHKMSYDN